MCIGLSMTMSATKTVWRTVTHPQNAPRQGHDHALRDFARLAHASGGSHHLSAYFCDIWDRWVSFLNCTSMRESRNKAISTDARSRAKQFLDKRVPAFDSHAPTNHPVRWGER
jgi:hypothetical protein